MKKIVYLILSIMVVIGILITIPVFPKSNKEILVNDKENNYLINSNAITMMYETSEGSGEYQTTTDTSWPQEGYIFNERLSGCENGGTLSWNSESNRVIMQSNTSDRCYVYFDVYSPLTIAKVCSNEDLLSECIKILYNEGGEGYDGLYYHDGIGSYTNADQEAGDNSYRYSGANPNNYVCFGSDAATCPDEYLYRIIGVFDDDGDGEYSVKLIKADYTTSDMLGTNGRDYYGNYSDDTSQYKGSMDTGEVAAYRWNYDTSVSQYGSSDWTTSELNKINLNTNYLNYIGSPWNNMIEDATWYLGAATDYMAKNFYNEERENGSYSGYSTIYGPENANGNSTKIGLMYASDYGYAASPENWLNNLNEYHENNTPSNNWLYMGLSEWTITPYLYFPELAFFSNKFGSLNYGDAYNWMSVRPVFYLKSNISYVSGTGTQDKPIRIN